MGDVQHTQELLVVGSERVIHASSRTASSKGKSDRRRSEFERICCALALAMVVMYLLLSHHLHPRNISLMPIAGFNSEPQSYTRSTVQPAFIIETSALTDRKGWGIQLL